MTSDETHEDDVEEPDIVIQDRCRANRCDDPGGCPGKCTCPCHLMDPELVEQFARGLRDEPTDRCGYCGRWLWCRTGSIRLPRHNLPEISRRCIGSGSFPQSERSSR